MLSKIQILKAFSDLASELGKKNQSGEILLCGGAVMCLVFETRVATKDIDAIFAPTAEIRAAAAKVAAQNGLPPDWINAAAKDFFLSDPPRVPVLELPHLRVYAPSADYMLAMKAVSARFDTHDRDDLEFLIQHLDLKTPEDVFATISKYYPREEIPPKTQFLVEEVLGE